MATPITSIDQLIECFDEAEPDEQVQVLKRIEIPEEDFVEFATWEEKDYTRNCLARKDHFEFILLCWEEGSKTPVHGHGGQNCWVYQVSGSIREKRISNSADDLEVVNDDVLSAGQMSYMNDEMGYHTIENNSSKRAMTLHIYANPIDRCEVFNEEKKKFEVVEMEYDTVEGMKILQTGS